MDERNKIIRNVIDKVKMFNINNGIFEGISCKLQEQLVQIEIALQLIRDKQLEIAGEIKQNKLSLLSVVNRAEGVPRSQVYNHKDTLEKYINLRIKEIEQDDILGFNKMETMKKDYKTIKEFLEKVQTHLIENQILETKIEYLENELKGSIRQSNEFQIQMVKLQQENQRLSSRLNQMTLNKSNLMPFK